MLSYSNLIIPQNHNREISKMADLFTEILEPNMEPARNETFSVKWSGVGKLLATSQPSESNKGGIQYLQELNLKNDWHSPVMRKLLNEAHSIFINLQETSEHEKPSLETLQKTSLQYRAVIQSCVLKIKEKIKDERNRANIEKLQTELDYFSIMEMVWHLCEVLWVETPSGGYCLHQLLTWVKWHFNDPDQLGQDVMSSDDPYSHPNYWTTIYGFVFQGRLVEVSDLLKHHPYRDSIDVFANLEDLLNSMPVFKVLDGQSVNEFLSKWTKWQNECSSQLKNGYFSQYPEIEKMMEIICGDDKEVLQNSHVCQSWQQLMVAKILYTDPTVKTFNLKQYAVESMEQFNGIGKVTKLDEIILSILSYDMHKVIEKCSEALPTWWFSAHLTDLLSHAGLLKSFHLDYGDELREFLLLEFAASLMSHSSLWVVGADYLMSNCPTSGRHHLERYIEKIPIDCEKKALKIIRLCEKYGFAEQSRSICKVLGMKALRRNRLGVALSWCLRAKDEEFAAYLTEKFLNHYIDTGKFTQCDLIDNLGSSMLLNNKLTFLGKYYEFHKLYSSEEFNEAASLLVSLLTSNLAPKRFWMILLTDALPLLESKEMIISSEQTFELLQCLKELQLCHEPLLADTKHMANKVIEEEENDRIQLLNLALTKNLSRALLVV
eukprot:TCONS_00052656-protein